MKMKAMNITQYESTALVDIDGYGLPFNVSSMSRRKGNLS
jgi:hypothetical protein